MDSRAPMRVVVGVDASDSARAAAEWAADIAAAWCAPLHLVHTVPGVLDEPPVGLVPAWLRELVDAAERTGCGPGEVEVVPGGTMELLTERASHARMLVLGSYGDGAWSGMLAGSVALTLAGRVGCPVAVVRGSAPQVPPPRGGPVVAGVDGSQSGRAALLLAADLAASLGTRLVAVHTWSDVVAGSEGGAHRRPEDWETLAEQGGVLLDGEIDAVSACHPELPVERRLVGDTPVRALLDWSSTARMLVVGHHGHRPGRGMLLGSTSRALVEFAPCPVVVTPPKLVSEQPKEAAAAEVTG
ncbi:MAG: UspA protein [Pseudonocardia sp.]|jgi:nucleotide-binding universal stress UspA family protein|nr:UspA protein [Pseudonocardia sp.]